MTRKTILIAIILLFSLTSLAFAQNNFPVKEGTYLRDSSRFNPGRLEITNVTADSFEFKLMAWDGGRSDGESGTATITGNTAVFNYSYGRGEYTGALKFTLSEDTFIIETQPHKNRAFRGRLNGTYRNKEVFTPNYDKEIEDFYSELFTDKQKSIFKNLVGDKYRKFAYTAQYRIYKDDEEENRDDYDARIYAFHVMSLVTIAESIIIVRDSNDTIWCAIRNFEPDSILYYSNDANKHEMPKTIKYWCDRKAFKDLPIIYMSDDKDKN